MAKTDNFRIHHKEISAVMADIEKILDPSAMTVNASEAVKLLVVLSGKISFHLGMEDKHLYPSLQNSKDEKLKTLADEYIKDMGTLAGAFKDYSSAWLAPQKIQANPDGFITQTKAVFQALRKRIEREETTLYPLADQL